MVSKLKNLLEVINSANRGQIIKILCQTWFYGIYLCLVPIALHAMVTNGPRSRARKWLLAITITMFALMTVYWIVSVVFTFLRLDLWNDAVMACYGSHNAFSCLVREVNTTNLISTEGWLAMFDDILFVNYIIPDGIVVWRAWVLCSDQSRVVMMIPVVMLGINTIIYLMTIVERAIQILFIFKLEDVRNILIVSDMITITQTAHLTLSLLINIFATSIIALKAWKHRKLLMESGRDIRTPRQAFMILAILVESGMIYILIGVTSVVSIYILTIFKGGQIHDLLILVGIQLGGIYPIAVILLVEKKRSLNSTFSSFGTIIDVHGDRPSQAEPMAFASGSVLVSGGETDSVTRPPHTTIHITFDHMLEAGVAGMGAGTINVSNEGHAVPY